jgi:predicted DNA-binding transcriptional regulator AlpA
MQARTAPHGTKMPVLLGPRDLSIVLQISERSIKRLLARGDIPAPHRFGNQLRWRSDEIRAWLEAGMPKQDRWNELKEGSP